MRERQRWDAAEASRYARTAYHLDTVARDYAQAENFYRQALALDPRNARNLSLYAYFLATVRRDFDGADQLFRRSAALDPSDAENLATSAAWHEDPRSTERP
jgi:Flp pilus assembly protein TadD